MNDRERVDTFLSLFKKLEKELVLQSKIKDDDFISFSRALNKIHYDRLNSVVAEEANYSFLKTCAEIRNLLSHEENTVVPTEEIIERLKKILQSIMNPLTCYQVCSKNVFTCSFNDRLNHVMVKMNRMGLSHVPVVDTSGKVIGVFSRETFFDSILQGKEFEVSEDLMISDFRNSISLEEHLNESYLFVKRRLSTKDAYGMLLKRSEGGKRVSLLLVTENGKQNEKLLGVITALDLAKISAED